MDNECIISMFSISIMHMEMLGVCPVRADMTLHELKDAGGQALVLIPFSVLDLQFSFWLSTFRPLSYSTLSAVQMADSNVSRFQLS